MGLTKAQQALLAWIRNPDCPKSAKTDQLVTYAKNHKHGEFVSRCLLTNFTVVEGYQGPPVCMCMAMGVPLLNGRFHLITAINTNTLNRKTRKGENELLERYQKWGIFSSPATAAAYAITAFSSHEDTNNSDLDTILRLTEFFYGIKAGTLFKAGSQILEDALSGDNRKVIVPQLTDNLKAMGSFLERAATVHKEIYDAYAEEEASRIKAAERESKKRKREEALAEKAAKKARGKDGKEVTADSQLDQGYIEKTAAEAVELFQSGSALAPKHYKSVEIIISVARRFNGVIDPVYSQIIEQWEKLKQAEQAAAQSNVEDVVSEMTQSVDDDDSDQSDSQ